jgi:hypothetical protein
MSPSPPPAVPAPPPAVPYPPAAAPYPPAAVALPPASTSPTEPYPTYADPPPYPPQPHPYGYAYGPVAPPTNGLAIAALVVALVVCGPAGAIMGHIARNQIRERGEQGDGIALAAIIIGWVLTGLGVLACCGIFAIPALFGGASVFNQ